MNEDMLNVGYDSGLSTDESDFEFDEGSNDESTGVSDDELMSDGADFEDEEDDNFGGEDSEEDDFGEDDFGEDEQEDSDPDSPEALEALLNRVQQERPTIYNSLASESSAEFCKSGVIDKISSNSVVLKAIRFAAGTTLLGGTLYYENGGATVNCDLKGKTACNSISWTIKTNLNKLDDNDLQDVKCQGCKDETRYVPIAAFRGNDKMRHDACGCLIRLDGSVIREGTDFRCPICNGATTADGEACENCQKKMNDLESFITHVKTSLELQPGTGAGYEIENIIEDVAKTLELIYMSYALQLQPPKGVLTDFWVKDSVNGITMYSTACQGIKYKSSDVLPGEWDYAEDKVTYTSTPKDFMYHLKELGLIIKEAACQLYPLRTAGASFVSKVRNKESGLDVSFFGAKNQLTQLELTNSIHWRKGKYVSDFSAGGWHSYRVFGKYAKDTGTIDKMYTNVQKIKEKDANGVEKEIECIGALTAVPTIEKRLLADIRTEVWRFLESESRLRVVGDLPLECWQTNSGVYANYAKMTLSQLFTEFNKVKQVGLHENCEVVITCALRFILCAVIDYLMTFIVVSECNESTISFDVVYFEYDKFNVKTASSAVVSVGEAVQSTLEFLVKGNSNFKTNISSLSTFRKSLSNVSSAEIVSGYQSGGLKKPIEGANTGLSRLGFIRKSRYITVLNPEAYLGYPLFAYQPISRIQKLEGGLDSNKILIGETMQGAKVELENVMANDCACISLFAASRSGKGVMTLAMLGTLLQSGNPLVYLDGKPEMSGVLVDFILSLNEIASQLGYTEDALIKTIPAFEMYQPCTKAELNNAGSTYLLKMSKKVCGTMKKIQSAWLKYADNKDNVSALHALWATYFYGKNIPTALSSSLIAPHTESAIFSETGVNDAFSYLFRLRAYYLFYAMMRNSQGLGGRVIVISDEINRCNIAAALDWSKMFYETLNKRMASFPKKPTEAEQSELEQLSVGTEKFKVFFQSYFGDPPKVNKGDGTFDGNQELKVISGVERRQASGSKIEGVGDIAADPLYVLIGQVGNEVYISSKAVTIGRSYYCDKALTPKFKHSGQTLETYLMGKAVASGVCIQGNWVNQDSNGAYGEEVVKPLAVYTEVRSHYLHNIDDPNSKVSGFFAIRAKGDAPQIARTYLVLNNNIAEYTEDYKPGSKQTRNNVRPRTRAAILGTHVKDAKRIAEVDDKLNSLLFRNYTELKSANKLETTKWKRDPRVGFLGYFGMLLGIDLPDHVFPMTPTDPVDGVNESQEVGVSFNADRDLTPEGKERFKAFFEKFRDSCNSLESAFQSLPFVQYMKANGIRNYASIQEFIYDFDPRSFVSLDVMLMTKEKDLEATFAGEVATPYKEYAGKDIDDISNAVDTSVADEVAELTSTTTEPHTDSEYITELSDVDDLQLQEPTYNVSAINSDFMRLFENVCNQFKSMINILNDNNMRSVYAALDVNSATADRVLKVFDEFVKNVTVLTDTLYDKYENELQRANPNSNETYEESLNAYEDKYTTLAQSWIAARNQYQGQ